MKQSILVGSTDRPAPSAKEHSSEPLRQFCEGEFPLTGRLEPWMIDVVQDARLHALIDQYGSPLNLIATSPMRRNVNEILDVANQRGVELGLFFARKSNKCLSFVHEAISLGIGVDTASENELVQCLERGIAPEKLICTAAIKSESLLKRCVAEGVCVAIDNRDELLAASSIAESQSMTVSMAIRLGGFLHCGVKLPTRFGFDVQRDLPLIADLAKLPVNVQGVHFHLDGNDASQRVEAIEQCLKWINLLREHGQAVSFLDVGGGFPVSYLDDGSQWLIFWQELHSALLGKRPPITYRNHGIGLLASDRETNDREIVGQPRSYPYFQTPTRGDWFAKILDDRFEGESVARRLTRMNIQLRCEPGRSLMDGCGMTVARVEYRKQNSDGDWMIGLSMNRTQCRTTSDDFLVDPILVRRSAERPCLHSPAGETSADMAGYLVGAYCTEAELLSLRRLRFPHGVQRGDMFVFPNTAGYLMHFMESRSHQFPLAKNLLFVDGMFRLDPIESV